MTPQKTPLEYAEDGKKYPIWPIVLAVVFLASVASVVLWWAAVFHAAMNSW